MTRSLKILITGPESSGKSHLANHLKVYLNAFLVKEYAREYFRNRSLDYTDKDVLAIAKQQYCSIKQAIADKDIIVFDTGPYVLKVWWDERIKTETPTEINEGFKIPFDLVLCCKPDIPWKPDPLRENPLDRDRLFDVYTQELKKRKANFVTVQGDKEERLKKALTAIRKVVKDLNKTTQKVKA